MNNGIYKYYKDMEDQDIIIALNGIMSNSILVRIVELIKNKLGQEYEHQRTIKKVFSIFVEFVQNILHHSVDRVIADNAKESAGKGIIILSQNAEYYTISSGNLVENNVLENVIHKCIKINELSKDELKKYYKLELKKPREEGKTGGGIGLIDIARKANNKLEYSSNKVNDVHSFLTLSVRIKKEDK